MSPSYHITVIHIMIIKLSCVLHILF